ncbi:MAG: putative oxidoreductase YcjS [Lentisphaerae bacterium ADurb.Bin082]|nr:MAG: putative oxidoreductase YcjS [Lentisphaerae bacterium ADurb.Bin082]
MEKLRVGVVGVGSVVREIYQYLYFRSDFTPILDIVAVADPNDEFREWFCDTYNIPPPRRYRDYKEMFAQNELDVAQINTPDHIHAAPAIDALKAGMDVVVPKPTASTVKDTHAMIQTARETGRLLGVDFHKREDPRFKEAEARYQSGRYGRFQAGVWYMLDKLLVADPNHSPRFFASPDFAERNTPISFLTVHACDALIKVVDLKPVEVRATGFSHKMPSLSPIPIKGYDVVDTEIVFDNGGVAHIFAGWHLPNTAHALTVQSSRMICSEGMFDIGLDTPGLHEIHPDGIFEINPLFRNFEKDGMVTGYGISSPGRLFQKILADRNGTLTPEMRDQMMTATALGFYTSLVLEGAEESLRKGKEIAEGVTRGIAIDLKALLARELGQSALAEYGY